MTERREPRPTSIVPSVLPVDFSRLGQEYVAPGRGRSPWRRLVIGTARARALVVAGALAVGGLAASCTDDGNKDNFCERIGDTPEVFDILGELDASDPGGSGRRLEEGLAQFRALEADAPGEVRSDVARLRQGVEVVLEAVEANPDDLPAAREEILGRQDELSGLAQAGERVVDYARTECGIDLVDQIGGTGPEPTGATGTSDGTGSTGGSDPTDPEGTEPSDPTDPTDPDGTELEPDETGPDATTGTSLDQAPDGDGG